jgi:hypothetical protein
VGRELAPSTARNMSPQPSAAGSSEASVMPGSTHRANTQAIASILSVFSGYILPMMFGLLGTTAAAIRALHDKIRDNLLSPRDKMLTLTSLPIGAVAGLAVGLFFTLSNSTASVGAGPTGSFSLSAGGLAFLAGYASDAFFSFLDAQRSRVFSATNPTVAAPAARSGGTPPSAPAPRNGQDDGGYADNQRRATGP